MTMRSVKRSKVELPWKVNDVVEVYNAGSWNAATVLKYMTGNVYLVRLHGSCMELKVNKVHMRICQSCKNGQLVISPMGPGKSGVVKFSRNLISNNYRMMPEVQQAKNVCSPGLDASCLHLPSPSTLKRVSSHDSYRIEDYPRKKRAVEIMDESKRFKVVSTAPLLEKVDAIAYPQSNMGEKYMHYSFTNNTNQLYEMRKKNSSNVTTHFLETVEEPDYCCSTMSSVGSCSVISGSANEFFGDTLAGPCQDDEDTLRSDAESLDVEYVDEGCTIFQKEVVAERIHRLELNAYHYTLEAMYASGPLSWEKEELLTNLRISLNVSNDEHLTAIKNLISAGQSF